MKEPGLIRVKGKMDDVRDRDSRNGVNHVQRFNSYNGTSVKSPARANYTSKEQITKD